MNQGQSGTSLPLQVDVGTTVGRQDSEQKPVFWIWKPQNESKEYWIFFKYGQSDGFHPPGPSYPNVSWQLKWEDETFADYCRFFDWVVTTYSVDAGDLTIQEHDISTVTCTSREITNA